MTGMCCLSDGAMPRLTRASNCRAFIAFLPRKVVQLWLVGPGDVARDVPTRSDGSGEAGSEGSKNIVESVGRGGREPGNGLLGEPAPRRFQLRQQRPPLVAQLDDRGAPVREGRPANHEPGCLELADAQGDGGRLITARRGQLSLG